MTLVCHDTLAVIDEAAWNRIVDGSFPFHDYRFLRTLETSGCVGEATGWEPAYFCLSEGTRLVAATWCYRKRHSYGEYVFDWSWADAWQRFGVPYYPKVVGAVPFTPATGPKLLLAPDTPADAGQRLLAAVAEFAKADSGLHWLFLDDAEIATFTDAGYLIREGCQFHWRNRDYDSFADFLAALKPKRRRDVRRERRLATETVTAWHCLSGDALTTAHADLFYDFYCSTIERKWSDAYLNRAFFRQLFAVMPEAIVLQLAEDGDGIAAGALSLRGEDALFGRYWGGVRRHPFLHFELCFYRGIDYAIENGLARYEAGAQGPHKINRGFDPVITRSAHRLAEPQLHAAVARFVAEEARQLRAELRSVSGAYR